MSEKILSFCDISGNSVKNYQGSRKYIATGDIVNNKICSYTEVEYKSKPSRANQEAELGDVLFAKMKETRKVICITEDNVDCIYSTGFYVIKPKKSVLTEYLYWLFNSSNFNRNKDKLCKGATQKALNNEGLKKIAIKKLPTIEEQKNIVSKLNIISSLINSKMKQLELLDELIKSQFVEMFGDPVSNNLNWNILKMSELGTLERGTSKHRPRNAPELLGGIYPLIQTGDVSNSGLYITDYKSTYSELGLKQSKMWRKDTLCITIAANIAQTSILTFDACFPDSVVGFITNALVNNIFIHYWFGFLQKNIDAQATQVAQKNINLKVLNNLDVIVPPIELQNQFADIVKQIDKQKFEIEKSLKEMQELYESLMEKYFG